MSAAELSPMTSMSRAIRTECQRHAPTLAELPDDVLFDFVCIVGAFYGDLREEHERRATQQPSDSL